MSTIRDGQSEPGTRQRILDVSSRLFAERGYRATSVRDIAAELGIANPSLYYHFKSKSDILVELLNEALTRVEVGIHEAEVLTGEARIRRIIQGLLESLEMHSGIGVTALREIEQMPEVYEQLALSEYMQVPEMLAKYAAEDNRDLRVMMAMAGVGGVVQDLLRSSGNADLFVAQLQEKQEAIIDLAVKILRG